MFLYFYFMLPRLFLTYLSFSSTQLFRNFTKNKILITCWRSFWNFTNENLYTYMVQYHRLLKFRMRPSYEIMLCFNKSSKLLVNMCFTYIAILKEYSIIAWYIYKWKLADIVIVSVISLTIIFFFASCTYLCCSGYKHATKIEF